MKAVLCKEWGPPESLVLEDIPAREPGPGQVRIRVRAASVNFPDVLIIQNKYQFKPERPFSPGSEAAGDVISVGEGVTHVKAGDRVLASTGHGSFAEEVIASAEKVVLLPPGLGYDVASAFMLTYGTSWHALTDRAALKAGETVLVLGAAGGVGISGGTQVNTLNFAGVSNNIGKFYGGYWPGFITNLRVTVGSAVYASATSTVTAPIAPLGGFAGAKYLMLGAAVTTDSVNEQTVTNNGTVTQSATKPF
jgi:D-arabinose 1-dehydrogenase-like Zn-dependent alcohol dehydrogenase